MKKQDKKRNFLRACRDKAGAEYCDHKHRSQRGAIRSPIATAISMCSTPLVGSGVNACGWMNRFVLAIFMVRGRTDRGRLGLPTRAGGRDCK